METLVARGTHFVRWGSGSRRAAGADHRLRQSCGRTGGDAASGRAGRKRIAFLGDATDHYPEFHDRYRGYCDALAEAGWPATPHSRSGAISSEEEGERAARELLARGKPFDGIMAASDLIALAAMRVLAEAGLRVPPTDISLVGFDDIPAASFAHPPLTTVVQDAAAAAGAGPRASRRNCGTSPTPNLLPATLVVRGSSIRP